MIQATTIRYVMLTAIVTGTGSPVLGSPQKIRKNATVPRAPTSPKMNGLLTLVSLLSNMERGRRFPNYNNPATVRTAIRYWIGGGM
jgi:hypothetical protein